MTSIPLPVLGSDLLAQARLSTSPSRQLQTSFPCIDTAVGGIKYGRITSIQSDNGAYGTIISHHIIASHLLSNPGASQVAYVDTTGNFSAVNLLMVLEFRLQQQRGTTQEPGGDGEVKGVRERAVELLDKVQYMRTFNIEGVMDTMTEVFGGIQMEKGGGGVGIKTEDPNDDDLEKEAEAIAEEQLEQRPEVDAESMGLQEPEVEEEKQQQQEEEGIMETEPERSPEEGKSDKTTIPDSVADSDEEIFWPIPLLPKHDPGLKKKRKQQENCPEDGILPEQEETLSISDEVEIPNADLEAAEEPPIASQDIEERPQAPLQAQNFGVIIFDTISRPLEDLLDKGDVEANSTLTLLSRSLRSLAQDKGIAILLLSTPTQHPLRTKEQKRDMYLKNSSIFARIQTTDGLPRTLGCSVDYGIMVSRYPKDDMKPHRRRSGGHDKYVIEVVSDRHGGGTGQWSAFVIKGAIEFENVMKEGKEEKNLDYLLTDNERRGKGGFGRWSRD